MSAESPTKIRAHLRERGPLLVALALGLGVALGLTWPDFAREGEAGRSLAVVLDAEVEVEPESVIVFGGGGALGFREVLFRGRVDEGAPSDLYYVRARITASGAVVATRHLSNLTRTGSADELTPVRVGEHHVAFLAKVAGRIDALTVLDLRGEPSSVTDDWPPRARAQNAVTNLLDTGRPEGFGRRRYGLAQAADDASLEVADGRLVVRFDVRSDVRGDVRTEGESPPRLVIDPERAEPLEGAEHVELQALEKGMPGTLTWVVDTVRGLSFVGPEPIAWLESRVFAVKDYFDRVYYDVAGGPDTEAEVAEELGVSAEVARQRAELSATDPELGWPPGPIPPIIASPARGEGEWIAIVDDPFLKAYPNAPPSFFSTFLQVDPQRPFTRVYVALWDPRQIQLRIMSGTQEPESATGQTAPGMVPRDDETLERVVAGFNGGFQSLHGEFGMMSEGRVYLPPKPWAATVAVYADGRVTMGSWRGPPEGVRHYTEDWATAQIPEGMVEYRQNLTSVVEDDRWNPWRRWYWGAAPQGDQDQVYIDRSGICLTREGFFAYFWGKSMGAEELGRAMIAARCVRGMHLDMNQRHTGFELYHTYRRAEPPTPVGRRLRDDFEFEIDVPQGRDWRVRGRLLASSMTPMRFPRYIRRDARDFFYLTQRPVLPGPHLAGEIEGEGTFDAGGLPNAGWPHAFARAWLGAPPDGDGGRTWLVRIDPSRAVPQPLARAHHGRALGYLTAPPRAGGWALVTTPLTVGRRWAVVDVADAGDALVVLRGEPLGPESDAALGVDGDGFLVYAERAGDPVPLRQRLEAAGVSRAIGLPAASRLAFALGGTFAGPDAYVRDVDVDDALALLAEERPPTEVLFPDVEPRPYMFWGPMQDTRVRYLRTTDRPARFTAPEEEAP
ncbi:MAG: hypothetical protein KF901_25520 [Myxococcales bacterium]|nr:hypothetical protein [Myxococcales bacterium]